MTPLHLDGQPWPSDRQRRCRHRWGEWRRLGIFDSTEERRCSRCRKRQRRQTGQEDRRPN